MAATTLRNTNITNFDDKLKIYNSVFFNTITAYGGLLSEVKTITSIDSAEISLPTESAMAATGATVYSTAQFSNFIRNIINFDIKNFDALDATGTKLNFVKNIPSNGSPEYSFNNNIKTNIIETLKVINVFVDILEAYKFCITNNNSGDSNIPNTGYRSQMIINRIELVSDTSRFYDSSTMYPSKSTYKNVGYIRNLSSDGDASPQKTVLYLSIESFYTGMSAPYNYDNCFDKSKESGSGSMNDNITKDNNFFPDSSRTDPAAPITLENLQYARQAYNNKPSEDPSSLTGLTLDARNKALVKSLLKTLFNLNPDYRDTSVKALYYYYKFVQLYSTLIINASNVMYANVEKISGSGNNPKRIETRNMTTKNDQRGVSGIEITGSGRYYTAPSPITLTVTATSGGTNAGATCTVTSATKTITKGSDTVSITTTGTGYLEAPSFSATAAATIAVAASPGVTGVDAADAVQAAFKATIVPIAIEDITTTQDKNLEKMQNIMLEIIDTLSYITTTGDFTTVSVNPDLVITTNSTPASVSASTDFTNKIVINITEPSKYIALIKLNNDEDLVKDYIIYDKKNKHYYFILKVMDESNNDFKITIDAVFQEKDLPSLDLRKTTILFRNADKIPIVFPTGTTTIDIPSATDYLVIMKKDINAHKGEYITNREVVYKLDENIKFNTTKVEHHKKLYETQYNKNVFLNRQIISYNTIIGAIILMLVVINLFNIEKQLVKTISLASLGAILLLFAIYFISNITYVEGFLSDTSGNVLYNASAEYIIANPAITADGKKNAKLSVLTKEINNLNVKFIGYFEKIIITLPAADSTDFYSEIKDVITNDRDNKMYIDRMLEINKVQGTNDMDTIKYEIEQSKLYIMVLLVASIVFITLYNIYINYISNDKYLSLMLFICAIILIVIVSYYIINSNRRVRTVYKSIYWGPEDSVNF